jgi:prephenate dehydratase
MTQIVAIQGGPASFHDIASQQFFNEAYTPICCNTFAETCQTLVEGRANMAVCAIENSLFGSINEVYDLLLKHKLWIVGEVFLRVDQCLIGLPGASIKNITEVYSQLPALAQCEDYLDTTLPTAKRFETHDTATSVAMVKEWADPTKAAIASRQAAKLHGLEVLAANIETHKQNYTRFLILQRQHQVVEGANKTSLVLETGHHAGALYAALGVFAKRGINLTKLQSRPIVGRVWHYVFYIDATDSAESPDFKQALKELKSQDCQVTVLGSYPAAVANR